VRAPLKPLPEPADLDQRRVRKQARIGGLINEYLLVALRGRGFRHAQDTQGVFPVSQGQQLINTG
jgi:hypothetical protein